MLEVIEDEALMANALAVGRLLQDGLRSLAGRYEAIGDVRGAGLFVGVELVRDRAARTPDGAFTAKVVNALRQRRILLSASGPHANVLKIRPPLVFRPEHAAQFLDGLEGGAAGAVLTAASARFRMSILCSPGRSLRPP